MPKNVVGVKPLPVTVPINEAFKTAPFTEAVDEPRLKVNPPTVQKLLTVPESKFQGELNGTLVPGAMPAKAPDEAPTVLLIQETILVEVSTLVESVWAVPLKPMAPVIAAA